MMKKLFYILCLLVFVACSDDDDKNEVMMSDFDKPFTSISKSELKGMLQDFWLIDTIIDDYEEGHRMDVIRPIGDALEKYKVDINLNNSIIRSTRSTAAPVENKFTGMKLTWNPQKQDLDTTINADGFMEILIPYSLTDDSRNDLRIVVNNEWNNNNNRRNEITYYRDGQLIINIENYINSEEGIEYSNENIPPYFFSYKSTFKNNTYNNATTMQSTEITIRKEGGRSLFQSINMENGNASFLTECNNLRAHVTMNNYNNILQLLQRLRGNDNIDKLAFEILKKNMSGVIVFADRDEKIGDLDVYPDEEDDNLPLICRFQDGEEFRLPLIFFSLYD